MVPEDKHQILLGGNQFQGISVHSVDNIILGLFFKCHFSMLHCISEAEEVLQ